MAFYGPRPPLGERLRTAAKHPFVAALLGGLVVLLLGVVLIAAGAVGGEDKTTVVQSPIAEPASSAGDSKGLTVNQIYDQASPGVAYVRAEVVQRSDNSIFGLPQSQRGEATGSGFVIDESGDVLTNAHVVAGATKVTVDLGSKTFDAKIVGRDTSSDVALLKVDAGGKSLKPLRLGDSSKIHVGDPVVAIGNPFGLDRTVTTGIVSALQRQLKAPNGFTIEHVIQTDAAINPGNSGGPLIDSRGRVIGMNSQIATAGGNGSIGIGFAVPIDTAKKIAGQLKQSGKVQHAFLGITGVAITKSMSDSLNLPTDKGVLVQQVTGPAKKAGIKAGDTQVTVGGADIVLGGDVILEIDGKTVKSMNDVIGAVDSKKPGEQVNLKLLRGSKQRSATVELGNRPQNADQSFQQNQDQQLPPGLSP
jgi:S1-C subfamily serine protease